jgi:hypothetical protein
LEFHTVLREDIKFLKNSVLEEKKKKCVVVVMFVIEVGIPYFVKRRSQNFGLIQEFVSRREGPRYCYTQKKKKPTNLSQIFSPSSLSMLRS